MLIFAIAKFTEGAWIVVVLGPLMYFGLIRLHRQYTSEDKRAAREGRATSPRSTALRRNVVYVLIDDYDLAAARAVQYARSLNPTELRAIHFDIDPGVTRELESTWAELGPRNLTLGGHRVPGPPLERAALELAAEAARPLDTECTIVLPRRSFPTRLERVLHDRTADAIAEAVTLVPRASATVIPFRLDIAKRRRFRGALADQTATPQPTRSAPVLKADVLLAERSERRDAGVRRVVARAREVLRTHPLGERAQGRRRADARVHAVGRLGLAAAWCSRAAARSRASSAARGWSSRGPWARGSASSRSSIPTTSSSRARSPDE